MTRGSRPPTRHTYSFAVSLLMLCHLCGCAPQRQLPTTAPASLALPTGDATEPAAPASPASTAPPTTAPDAPPTPTPTTAPAEAEAARAHAQALETRAYETKDPADFRAAAQALDEAVRLNPHDVQLRKSLGYLYLDRLDDPARAYPHLRVAADAEPAGVGWAQMAARAAAESGRTDAAIALYRRIIAGDPANVWDRLALAKLIAARGRHRQADALYRQAQRAEPENEHVNLAYAEYLLSRGERRRPERLARRVLARNPQSPGAHSVLGDLRRQEWDLAGARDAYESALAADPDYYTAREGLRRIERARAPKLASAFYYFEDTEDLQQYGLFNTVSFHLVDQIFADATANVLWFSNEEEGVETVMRLEEGLGLEYRFGRELSARVGVSAFQTESADDHVGFNASATWVPNRMFWGFAQYRENDPVNVSIFTVAEAFTQDVAGGGAGVQFSPRLWSSVAASTAEYSDGNRRRDLKADLSYLLLSEPLAYFRLEYELIDYERREPTYSSPQNYDYVRPVIELESRLTKSLSLHARLEVPYVVDEADWGVGIVAGPVWKWGDDRELRASYLRYDLPGDFAPYSGEGFKISLVYRF